MKPTLKDLIDEGLISPGSNVLEIHYRDTIAKVTLLKDGKLTWNKQTFSTPSEMSRKFKMSIFPKRLTDNGWDSLLYKGIRLNKIIEKVPEVDTNKIIENVPEVDCGVDMITNHYDGGSTRPLCRHPYNSKHSQYGIPCSQHVPECMCPIHRAGSLWRKLTGSVRVDRNNKMMKNDTEYMKHVIGMGLDEYHNYLVSDFQKNFNEILPYEMLIKNFEELRAEKFVIDEIFPRCEGKHLLDPRDIAIFLAKVFNYRNTQLLLHNNVEARKHDVDTKQFKMLINSSKNGSVCPDAKNKFNHIEPSEEAISYMLEFVNRFTENLPKLEI
tara:strand:+ start:1817 stop:2794 length:978 start_codon:yes stop_codon:yes gene_type:complete